MADELINNTSLMTAYQRMLLFDRFEIGVAYLALPIGLIGIFGNIFSFIVLTHSDMRTSTNIILAAHCLSAAMTLIAFSTNIYILKIFDFYELNKRSTFLRILFPYSYPIVVTLQMICLMLTVSVSLNQFYIVYTQKFSSGKKTKQMITNDCKNGLKIVAFVYIFSILFCIPYFFKYEYVAYKINNHTYDHNYESVVAKTLTYRIVSFIKFF
jgi:hypothetical protein